MSPTVDLLFMVMESAVTGVQTQRGGHVLEPEAPALANKVLGFIFFINIHLDLEKRKDNNKHISVPEDWDKTLKENPPAPINTIAQVCCCVDSQISLSLFFFLSVKLYLIGVALLVGVTAPPNTWRPG